MLALLLRRPLAPRSAGSTRAHLRHGYVSIAMAMFLYGYVSTFSTSYVARGDRELASYL